MRLFSTNANNKEINTSLGERIIINYTEEDSHYQGPPLIEPKYSYDYVP